MRTRLITEQDKDTCVAKAKHIVSMPSPGEIGFSTQTSLLNTHIIERYKGFTKATEERLVWFGVTDQQTLDRWDTTIINQCTAIDDYDGSYILWKDVSEICHESIFEFFNYIKYNYKTRKFID